MTQFSQLWNLAPVVVAGSIAFYFTLPLLLVPQLRKAFIRVFTPLPPSSQTYLPGIDGLRGMAALGVAAFHLSTWLWPYFNPVTVDYPILLQTYKAVPLFVIISGLLIYRSLLKSESFSDLKHYATKRFFRIYPLYFVFTITFFMFAKIEPEPPSWTQRLLAEVFMMKLFGHYTHFSPPKWSLYVEELFYLSAPIWVACTRARPLLCALAGFLIFSLIGSAVPDELSIVKFFFVGIAICELLLRFRPSQIHAALIWAGGLALLFTEARFGDVFGSLTGNVFGTFELEMIFNSPFNPYDPYKHFYSVTLAVGLGAVVFGSVRLKAVAALLSIPAFRFLGTISYSVFIWNGFLIMLGTRRPFQSMAPTLSLELSAFPEYASGTLLEFAMIYFPSFIFFGAVSYLVVERPFLLLRRKI